MGRIIALDYGKKRTGLAVTDPLKIIATALDTVSSTELISYLKVYCSKEQVEALVLGLPVNLRNEDTPTTEMVREFKMKLEQEFPDLPIHLVDERFTSKIAFESLIASGVKKKNRQIKGNIDKISAVIILQSYLQSL